MSSVWRTGTNQSLKHGSQFDIFTLGCPFRNSKEEEWGIHLRPNSQPEKVEWPNEKNTNEERELAYSDFACALSFSIV